MEAQINGERLMSALTQVASMLDLGDPYDRQKYVVLLSSGFERQPGSIHYATLLDYANYSDRRINPLEVRAFSNDLSHKIVDLTDIMKRCRCTVYSMGTLSQSAFIRRPMYELSSSQPVVSRFSARSSLQGPLNALARDTGGKPFFGSDMGMGLPGRPRGHAAALCSRLHGRGAGTGRRAQVVRHRDRRCSATTSRFGPGRASGGLSR